jgi:hypothetical protein
MSSSFRVNTGTNDNGSGLLFVYFIVVPLEQPGRLFYSRGLELVSDAWNRRPACFRIRTIRRQRERPSPLKPET